MIKNLYDNFANSWYAEPSTTIYVCSDPHFSDGDAYVFRKLLQKPYTEEELKAADEEMVRNINRVVGKKDTLIILGDIGNLEYVKKLRGHKILIMGNHDKGASNYKKEVYHDIKFIDEFPRDFVPEEHGYEVVDPTPVGNIYDKVTTNHLFDEVYEGPLMVNDRLILSHEPIYPLPPYMYNIHGHVHNNTPNDEQHLNVCMEHIDYIPLNLTNMLKKGLLRDIDSIHREAIDRANKRKKK